MIAAMDGRSSIVDLLLQHQADITLEDIVSTTFYFQSLITDCTKTDSYRMVALHLSLLLHTIHILHYAQL